MKKNKIIAINGNDKNIYEQAIFILKPNASNKNVDLVKEAEKIINNYVMHSPSVIQKDIKKKSSSSFDFILNTMLLICVTALSAIITYNFF